MSKGRSVGDWVWLKSYAGFLKANGPMHAQIKDDGSIPWCLVGCKKEDCLEWVTLHTKDGNMLCHVNECEMFDSKEEALVAENKGKIQ